MGLSTKRKQACFLPRDFKPLGKNELIRLGSDNKGGYVVSADAVTSTRYLLSLGLGNRCEFELDFAAMARLKRLHAHDPALDADELREAGRRSILPFFGDTPQRRRARAHLKNYRTLFTDRGPDFRHSRDPIGLSEGALPLHEALAALGAEPGRGFLKCDIGGAEYEMLDAIIEANESLSGLVIAFHDVPARLREIRVFLMAMKDFMVLDNIVADNRRGVDPQGLPNVITLSMSTAFPVDPHIPTAGATRRYKILNEPDDPSLIDFEILYVDDQEKGTR